MPTLSDTSELKAGFILHRRPYSDSSLLLEVVTQDEGRRPLIARGARGAKRNSARLQPFAPLWLRWSGRGEVGTLSAAEPRGPAFELVGRVLYCGIYLNELLMRLAPRADPLDELFSDYEGALARLALGQDIEPTLRIFEMQLLDHLGYGLVLTHGDEGAPIDPMARYDYHPQQGAHRKSPSALEGTRGTTLLAMARRDFSDPQVRSEALRLMRRIIDHYLDHRPLKSRELFAPPF